MNDVALAIEEARSELAQASAEFLPGTCSLIAPTKVSDGKSGHTVAMATVASNIPIKVEHISGGIAINQGGITVIKSHRLTLPVRSETLLIDEHYQVALEETGTTPAMIFEQPISQMDSMSPFLVLAASFVMGYRQPGVA